jgi:hypothetical protein
MVRLSKQHADAVLCIKSLPSRNNKQQKESASEKMDKRVTGKAGARPHCCVTNDG